jgi:hypothetical protein
MQMTTVSWVLSLTLLPVALLATFVILEGGLFKSQPSPCRRRAERESDVGPSRNR